MNTIAIHLNPLLTSCHLNLPHSWVDSLLSSKHNHLAKTTLHKQNNQPSKFAFKLTWDEDPERDKTLGAAAVQASCHLGWAGGISGSVKPPQSRARPSDFGMQESFAEVLELNDTFGRLLGLKNMQQVKVEILQNMPLAKAVFVEPLTNDDWEIIELQAGYLENNLLSQIRVVSPNQPLLVRIRETTLIRLRITELQPNTNQCLRLDNNVEVIVAPKVRRQNQLNASSETASAIPDIFRFVRIMDSALLQLDELQTHFSLSHVVYIHATTDSKQQAENNNAWAFPVVARISPILFIEHKPKDTAAKESQAKESTPEQKSLTSIVALVVPSPKIPEGHAAFSSSLIKELNITEFSRAKISQLHRVDASNFKVVVRLIQKSKETESKRDGNLSSATAPGVNQKNIGLNLLSYIESQSRTKKVAVATGMRVTVPTADGGASLTASLELAPTTTKIGNMDLTKLWIESSVAEITRLGFEAGDVLTKDDALPKSGPVISHEIPPMGGYDLLIQEITKKIQFRLRMRTSQMRLIQSCAPGGFLLHGNRGSGKSLALKHVSESLRSNLKLLANTETVDCKKHKTTKPSDVVDMLTIVFMAAVWKSPSVVILDDLDSLTPPDTEEGKSGRSRQIAEGLKALIRKYTQLRRDVVVVATASDKAALSKTLIDSHMFDDVFHLSPPTKAQRRQILQALSARDAESLDLNDCISRTEGYSPADLRILVDRARHSAANRVMEELLAGSDASSVQLTSADFSRALDEFTPSALKGVRNVNSGVSWKDIGGLNQAKQTLIETLEWPAKYGRLFEKCPLRLRSGILLYGFPGCGKTLLASAVAKECGMNFISVKGPEVLNKYIGASEQAVRDLFDRAQAAKPCILFFDEFESIAPRRGNDNSGVTDRVVNQILTQMDGAEGIDGVYVLGATSRPDLIDPALLRPGRLDKSVLCGIPTLEEREDILATVGAKFSFHDDVDLHAIANRCKGFTGADLQGLLYSASLEAIHESFSEVDLTTSNPAKGSETRFELSFLGGFPKTEHMPNSEKSKWRDIISRIEANMAKDSPSNELAAKTESTGKAKVMVCQRHFESVLKSTGSSLGDSERSRLERIYAEFRGDIAVDVGQFGKKTAMR